MKIITISIPILYLDALKIMEDLGIYPSRSEQIRLALNRFLHKDLDIKSTLEDMENFKELIKRGRNIEW